MDSRVAGSMLGTAVGDSLGLPLEGLSRQRGAKLFPGPVRQRFFFGRGALSDDTLQTLMVLEGLRLHPSNPTAFASGFAGRLKRWFWSLPPGIGLSTAKACLRLSAGIPPALSGVRSGGNGAAMRSAIIGAFFAEDSNSRIKFVEASARVTHTLPIAIQGAQLVALAAACSANGTMDSFDRMGKEVAADWDFDAPWPERGPSGYVLHSVNAALWVWRRHPASLQDAVEEAVQLGGDSDSVAAMVGGIVGTADAAVPHEWLRWVGFPRPAALADACVPGYGRLLASHLFQLPIVLGHGFRRMMPPY